MIENKLKVLLNEIDALLLENNDVKDEYWMKYLFLSRHYLDECIKKLEMEK